MGASDGMVDIGETGVKNRSRVLSICDCSCFLVLLLIDHCNVAFS